MPSLPHPLFTCLRNSTFPLLVLFLILPLVALAEPMARCGDCDAQIVKTLQTTWRAYKETFIQPDGTLSMTPYYALDLMDDTQARTSGNYTALTAETVSGWAGTGTKRKRIRFFGLNGKTLLLKWYHATVAQNFIFHPSTIHFDWKSGSEIA